MQLKFMKSCSVPGVYPRFKMEYLFITVTTQDPHCLHFLYIESIEDDNVGRLLES